MPTGQKLIRPKATVKQLKKLKKRIHDLYAQYKAGPRRSLSKKERNEDRIGKDSACRGERRTTGL
jgi:hypothetical protein